VLDYDLVVLAVAIAVFARRGFGRGFRDDDVSVLAAVSRIAKTPCCRAQASRKRENRRASVI
jgi:hypothetical protein